jgi:hypothetical protein
MSPVSSPNTINKVVVLTIDDSVDAFAIPDAWRGHLLEFLADGADCDILFGTSTAVTCTYGQAASVDGTTKVITAHAASGGHLVSKVAKRIRIPRESTITHFAVDCVGSGSGKLYIERVEGD